MKNSTLHAFIAITTAAILTGCAGDLTHSRDIYRNEYKYKPTVQKEDEPSLPPTPGMRGSMPAVPPPAAAPAPATEPAPAPAAGGDAAPSGADAPPAQ